MRATDARLALVGAGALALAGCSTADPRPLEKRDDLVALRTTVAKELEADKVADLDLQVYVAPVVVEAREDDWSEDDERRYGMSVDRAKLAEELGYVLSGPFRRVAVHPTQNDTLANAKAAAFEGHFDVLVVPRVKRWDAVFVKTNGWWWPNALFLYWYFYFPSWGIADEVYGCRAVVDYQVLSVKNERPLPGLEREVVVDSVQTVEKDGEEIPQGPRLDLDDLDRGLSVFGTYRPGKLDLDQWRFKVEPLVEPWTRRAVVKSFASDLARGLATFRALPDEKREAAIAALHAVAVGVGEYGPSDPCRFADRDAQAFASFLSGEPDDAAIGSSVALTPAKLVRTLTNGRATRSAVEKALDELAVVVRPEDTAVFYFAGRGARRAGEGLASLGLECGRAEGAHEGANVLGLDALRAALAKVPARRKVVILDASFGAGARASDGGPPGQWTRESLTRAVAGLAGPGGVVVLAAGPGEPASVLEAAKHGLLTYALVDGLEGAADADGSRSVSWGELRRHVEATVSALSALDAGQAQRPVFCLTEEGRAALAVDSER